MFGLKSKLIIGGVVALAFVGLFAHNIWQKTKIQALLIDNQQLKIEYDLKAAEVIEIENSYELSKLQLTAGVERIRQVEVERNEARKKVVYMKTLFADHNFAELLQNKPGIIEKRMIKKTAEVLEELENVSRSD